MKILAVLVFISSTKIYGISFEERKCKSTLLEEKNEKLILKRTFGVEWEFGAANFRQSKVFTPLGAQTYRSSKKISETKFREIFSLYGTNSFGKTVEWLIPGSVVSTQGFSDFVKKYSHYFKKKKQTLFMVAWNHIPENEFDEFFYEFMTLKGRDNPDLVIRKNKVVWGNFTRPMDFLIEEKVAEEWRGETFVNIEFPMKGGTNNPDVIEKYIYNLWDRLKYSELKKEEVLFSARGHVHWVPEIMSVPSKSMRKKLYASLVGFWGDSNDSWLINKFNILERELGEQGESISLGENGVISFSKERAAWMYRALYKQVNHSVLSFLTRGTYNRLSISEKGISVKEGGDLEQSIDPHFPPVFKLLPFALRGIYSPIYGTDRKYMPAVGLESRTQRNIRESFFSLPMDEAEKSVDVSEFLLSESSKSRGILNKKSQILVQAKKLGIDSFLIEDVFSHEFISRYSNLNRLFISTVFIPLNPWLRHPLSIRNLNKLSTWKRKEFVDRFEAALARYVTRVNSLARARKNKREHYVPEWSNTFDRLNDEYENNRVFPRSDYPSRETPLDEIKNPDFWFRTIISSEMMRFITESGISQLIKMPKNGSERQN